MCIAVPGRVVLVDADGALVEVGGRTRRALTLLEEDVSVGDDVLVSSGLIVARLSPGEAEMRRGLFDQLLGLVEDTPRP